MEKVSKKRSLRGVKGKTALLLLLCACVAAGAAAWALRPRAIVPALPETPETHLLLSRPVEEIASLLISPLDALPYTLERYDGAFALKGQENVRLRQEALEELELSVGVLPAERLVLDAMNPEQGLVPAAFGLDPAQTKVKITYQDGEDRELLIGGETPNQDTPTRYCMVAGDERLYTILTSDSDSFFHEMDYLRDFAQPTLDGSLLGRVDVTGKVTLSARYTPTGWQMEAPFSYPMSPSRMNYLLSQISGMAFEALLGEAGEMDLSLYGLEEPEVTVRLTQAATVLRSQTNDGLEVAFPIPEKTYELLLGRDTEKSGVYVLWNGQVFKASNFLLGFWKTLDPRDFALTTPVNFPVNQLDTVEFSCGKVKRQYEVRMGESITQNNQIAVDEYGRILYDMAVRKAGHTQDMDAQRFASWYTLLSTLSGDGELPESYALSGEPEAVIVLKNSALTRTIQFYPFDALHDALAVDGVALYYVQRDWLERVMEAP